MPFTHSTPEHNDKLRAMSVRDLSRYVVGQIVTLIYSNMSMMEYRRRLLEVVKIVDAPFEQKTEPEYPIWQEP